MSSADPALGAISEPHGAHDELSIFEVFTRAEWAALRDTTPVVVSEDEAAELAATNEPLSMTEVRDVYLPLARLLNIRIAAHRGFREAMQTFLDRQMSPRPYIVGIGGSVAVGKSTAARVLQAVLARWPEPRSVELVTTDGFLYPNSELVARGLMDRKGFPESYDLDRLVRFLDEVRSGEPEVRAPVYSHLLYDVVPGEERVIRQPSILIVEGLNILQTPPPHRRRPQRVFVSDFFDFSMYIDAEEAHIARWYRERFLKLCETAFQDPRSHFHHYATLGREEAERVADGLWRTINEPNLHQNIAPTKRRAHLVLAKDAEHEMRSALLRRP